MHRSKSTSIYFFSFSNRKFINCIATTNVHVIKYFKHGVLYNNRPTMSYKNTFLLRSYHVTILNYLAFQSHLIMSVPAEGYSRNRSVVHMTLYILVCICFYYQSEVPSAKCFLVQIGNDVIANSVLLHTPLL